MVVSRLIGGLGNQMFQYAAGMSLAAANDCDFKLDVSGYKNYTLHNGFELDLFNIHATVATSEEISSIVSVQSRFARFMSTRLGLSNQSHFVEKSFSFDRDIFNIRHSAYIDGYWQSYKYFESIALPLRTEFTPKNPLSDLNFCISQQISKINAVRSTTLTLTFPSKLRSCAGESSPSQTTVSAPVFITASLSSKTFPEPINVAGSALSRR